MLTWRSVETDPPILAENEKERRCYFVEMERIKLSATKIVIGPVVHEGFVVNIRGKICWCYNKDAREGYGRPQASAKQVKLWLEIPPPPPIPSNI